MSTEYLSKLNELATNDIMEKAMKDKLDEYNKENNNDIELNNESENNNDNNNSLLESMDSEENDLMQKMKEKLIRNSNNAEINNNEEENIALPGVSNYKPGEYKEVNEDEFFKITTNAKVCVCHFFHKDFFTCKIIDKHLEKIAYDNNDIIIFKIDVDCASFLVKKMKIQVLPTIVIFKDGVVTDMIIGFQDVGDGSENITASDLTRRLSQSGIFKNKAFVNKLEKHNYKNLHNNYYNNSDSDDN